MPLEPVLQVPALACSPDPAARSPDPLSPPALWDCAWCRLTCPQTLAAKGSGTLSFSSQALQSRKAWGSLKGGVLPHAGDPTHGRLRSSTELTAGPPGCAASLRQRLPGRARGQHRWLLTHRVGETVEKVLLAELWAPGPGWGL